MSIFNNPELREITISSASVTATARGMAKLYGILGNGGAVMDKPLISEKILKKMQKPLVSGFDAVTQTPGVKFGPGTSIKENPKVFSHVLKLFKMIFLLFIELPMLFPIQFWIKSRFVSGIYCIFSEYEKIKYFITGDTIVYILKDKSSALVF